jgi:hypothetical protein
MVPAMSVTLKDGQNVFLGRKPLKARAEMGHFVVTLSADDKISVTPNLHHFYNAALDAQPPPATVDYSAKAMASINRMYKNGGPGGEGCCVLTSSYHGQGVWSGNESGTPVLGTDTEVDTMYHGICGPGDPGCDIQTVLDYWRTKGLPFNGVIKKIDDYVAVDWTNKTMVQVAIDIFGGGRIGINLPNDWTCTGCTWGPTTSAIVGGHDVRIIGYNADGVLVSTWANIVLILWEVFLSKKFLEEMYVELAPDWYSNGNLAPNGINVAALRVAIATIRAGGIPVLGPPTPTCPAGQHWDPVAMVCVPDLPPSPPPQTFSIQVPQQPVILFGVRLGYVPAYTLTGTLGGGGHAALSPFISFILKWICNNIALLPPQIQPVAKILCGLVPHGMMEGTQAIPPIVSGIITAILNFLCANVTLLPAQIQPFVTILCGLIPHAAKMNSIGKPCGCM